MRDIDSPVVVDRPPILVVIRPMNADEYAAMIAMPVAVCDEPPSAAFLLAVGMTAVQYAEWEVTRHVPF